MTAELRPVAARALTEWGVPPRSLVPLAGDASTRRYLRGRDARGRSVVVMDCGEPLAPATPQRDGFAFTRWHAFYGDLGIRVPDVLGVAREAGLVLLEDLGDELLQQRLESQGAESCDALYLRAVQWGRLLAEEGSRRYDPSSDPDEDPLVPARLALEMDLFLAHASRLEMPRAQAGLAPLARAAGALDAAADPALRRARSLLHALCRDVHAAGPMALCHRDYHARNLIPCRDGAGTGETVAVIDFQDSRRGPRAYDLASLAWDPYVSLPEPMTERLVEAWRPAGVRSDDWDLEVRLAAGQRLLKAAGSYAWLSGERGRPQYAQWLAPALQRAWERLARWPERGELWSALDACGALGPTR